MPLRRYAEIGQSLRRLKQRFRWNEFVLIAVYQEHRRARFDLGGKRVKLALRRHHQQARISDDCRRCDGAAQADMQSHHRALAEADERERLRWQPMTRQLGIDEALQYRGRFVDADPALIWVAKGQANHWRPTGACPQASGACGETNAASGNSGCQARPISIRSLPSAP